jgi:hypothetical protein
MYWWRKNQIEESLCQNYKKIKVLFYLLYIKNENQNYSESFAKKYNLLHLKNE